MLLALKKKKILQAVLDLQRALHRGSLGEGVGSWGSMDKMVLPRERGEGG